MLLIVTCYLLARVLHHTTPYLNAMRGLHCGVHIGYISAPTAHKMSLTGTSTGWMLQYD
mgnify:CR=1 FL=1